MIVQVLTLFEDADLASDAELAHVRRNMTALVVVALVEYGGTSPAVILEQ